MKICILVDAAGEPRAGRHASSLCAAGHDVILVHVGRPIAPAHPRPHTRLTVQGVATNGGIRRLIPFRRLAGVAKRVRAAAPDVVQAQGLGMLCAGYIAARLASSRLVYDSPRLTAEGAGSGSIRRTLVGAIERYLIHRCSAVIAASAGAARVLQDTYRLETAPVTVHDIPDTVTPTDPPARLRERLGIGSAPLILHDGEGSGPRECERFVRALAKVPTAQLVVMGADRWRSREALELLAERLRVAGRMHLLKAVPPRRLATYAAEADVGLAVPGDGCLDDRLRVPQSLYAYLATGVPVVVAESIGIGPLLGSEDVGWAVDPTDPDSIAQALQLACGSERRRRLAAARRAGTPLTWKRESQRLLALYQRLPSLEPEASVAGPSLASRIRRALGIVGDMRQGATRRTLRHPRALVRYVRGRRLRAAGRYDAACSVLRRAVAVDPGMPRYALQLAAALKDAGDTDEAVTAYRRVIAAEGKATGTSALAAVNLARLGAREDASAVLEGLLARSRLDARAWGRVAEIRSALGDLAGGRAAIERAVALAPDDASLAALAMRVLEQVGEPTRAAELGRRSGVSAQARRVAGILRTLDPEWVPSLPSSRRRSVPRGRTVLHLLETSLPHATAGYSHRTATVLAAQLAAGCQPVAATRLGFPAAQGVAHYALVESVQGVIHHRFTLSGVRRYTSIPPDSLLERNARLLAGLARSVRPAAVQAATPHHNGLLGLALRDRLDVPLLYEVRGFPEMTWAVRSGGEESEIYRLRRAAETRCMRQADGVITLSDVMKDHIVKRGVDPSRVYVVPHMVDVEEFAPRQRDPELVRRYGLEGRLVVGYVGSLLEYEGLDAMLRALAHARADDPRVAGLVVGGGAAETSLRKLANDLDLDGDVTFTGRVPAERIHDHYALIDVFVCPRRDFEVCRLVTPLKPFEAMAAGRCVVVSDLPALTEPLDGGRNGRSFRADDPHDLARVIGELAAAPDGRRQLARAARAHVSARHNRADAADFVLPPLVAAGAIPPESLDGASKGGAAGTRPA